MNKFNFISSSHVGLREESLHRIPQRACLIILIFLKAEFVVDAIQNLLNNLFLRVDQMSVTLP